MESVMISSGPEVQLGAALVRVKKPRMRDYKRFLQVVAEVRVSVNLEALFQPDGDKSAAAFEALADVPDKVCEVCVLASDATREQALDAELGECLALFVACVKHANVVGILNDALKKVWGVEEPQS